MNPWIVFAIILLVALAILGFLYHIEQDASGNWSGWDRVLDYIGVEWRNPEQFFGGEKN